jgi:acetate kinase
MATRPGSVDPGALLYLLAHHLTLQELDRILEHESGLLGLSGLSGDVRELEGSESEDARLALAVYTYRIAIAVGAMTTALGGLDTLVFTGGIGENAPLVRERICDSLECFGIALEPDRNDASAPVISTDGAPVTVRVVTTNEELMIARHTWRVLTSPPRGE